eukprot:GEZU01024350.1.p1 GENE.GEZU01024350.1~~GEZU01024350.1.p1  ORF type:complete len:362 (+),score=108.05 GEZU01024350.1:183-1268(+)
MSLLQESDKSVRMNLLSTESFQDVFGKNKRRKKPKLSITNYEEMVQQAEKLNDDYDDEKDSNIKRESWYKTLHKDAVFSKGQSRRLWSELYKVIDSSDVLIQVLDARNPMGTRSPQIEKFLRTEKKHKHLVFVLNKCDLIPTWATARWVKVLSREYPTLAFHASITNPFGKGSLIQLLRQFAQLHSDKKNISVGFIGYPNVGKSSIINTLMKKKVCGVAPIPGETKVWQYITLMKRIFLIDCPGVVPSLGNDTDETDAVLKGVVRIENLPEPAEYIPQVLKSVKKDYLVKTYKVENWTDHVDFLHRIALLTGKLLKGAKADIQAVARKILYDWQRGRLPWFTPPPFDDNQAPSTVSVVLLL